MYHHVVHQDAIFGTLPCSPTPKYEIRRYCGPQAPKKQDTSLDGGKIEFWGVSLIMVVSCVQLFIVSSCHMTEFDPRSSSNIRCKGGSCWQYNQTKFMGLGHDLFALEQSECLLPKMQAT